MQYVVWNIPYYVDSSEYQEGFGLQLPEIGVPRPDTHHPGVRAQTRNPENSHNPAPWPKRQAVFSAPWGRPACTETACCAKIADERRSTCLGSCPVLTQPKVYETLGVHTFCLSLFSIPPGFAAPLCQKRTRRSPSPGPAMEFNKGPLFCLDLCSHGRAEEPSFAGALVLLRLTCRGGGS